MKKIVIVKKNTAVLMDAADRMPEQGEVRIKMAYSAVSAGTERAGLTGNEEGGEGFRIPFPYSPGYSGSGVITHVGPDVSEYRPGDRVMVHGGGHQQYCTVPQREIVPVPDHVGLDEAAMVIIAGFSLAAIRKARIGIGDSCLVTGLGILGLFAVQFARLSGAYPVIGSDFVAQRRDLAQRMGADVVLDPSEPDYIARCRALTGGASTAIEVTGNPKALKQVLACTAKFGRVLLLGCTRTMTEVDFYNDVHRPGIELIGAHSGARPVLESHSGFFTEMDDCRVILSYLSAGRLDFKSLISEYRAPQEAPDVYSQLAEGTFPIGVLFDWNKLDEG